MIEGSYFYPDGENFKLVIINEGKTIEYKLSRSRMLWHLSEAAKAIKDAETRKEHAIQS
jgi:hypothetical protein